MLKPLHLRPVIDADLPIHFEYQSDREAAEIAGVPSRDWEAFTAHWTKILADPQSIIRTIVYDGQVAGSVLSFDRAGVREVGYWIGRAFWGQGVATRALAEFLPLEPIRPLFAGISRANPASVRVVQKCGFVPAGDDGPYLLFKLG